ncbi:MAG TPA: hypothetical protein VJY62_21650 [Bacteroidia bacterium]|nr:hypothetical protein [Bacteroidia bacterium]
MKTILIHVDENSSAKLFMDLAKKLNFKARILNETLKEDAALLAIMEERKNEKTFPISKSYDILKKVK